VEVCQRNVTRVEQNPGFLSSINTCHESWIRRHDPESKQLPSVWKQRFASTEEISHSFIVWKSDVDIVL
jgi:hypothetical protein